MTKVEILEEYLQNLIKEKSECQNEEKIAEINERISCIADITKLVVRELNTPDGSEQEYLIKVINALFSSTAAIHVKTVDDDLTVEIFDNFIKKTVLTLNFKHYGCNLYFQSYKLGIEADQEVEVQSQLTELELYCIAQHYKHWYYSLIGKVNLEDNDALIIPCQKCNKKEQCVEEIQRGRYLFETFIRSINKLSKITGVNISTLK